MSNKPRYRYVEAWGDPVEVVADGLIERGWVKVERRQDLIDLLENHQDCWAEDDYNGHCECGKWIEYGQYEMENHQAAKLDDAGLLVGDDMHENA